MECPHWRQRYTNLKRRRGLERGKPRVDSRSGASDLDIEAAGSVRLELLNSLQPIATLRRVVIIVPATENRRRLSMETSKEDDSTSFDVFFRTARGPLVSMAYLLSGDLQVAQDLTQEALLRTWSRWPQIKSYDDPQAWTRRVLYNLVISWARGAKVRRRPVELPRSVPPPDELHLMLAAALRSLPERQVRALILHDGAGLSIQEVARELKVPMGTVKSWLSRGRAAAAHNLATRTVTKRGGPVD
jgi:RNA polymerase sigma-70 factor (ECF subfamily)